MKAQCSGSTGTLVGGYTASWTVVGENVTFTASAPTTHGNGITIQFTDVIFDYSDGLTGGNVEDRYIYMYVLEVHY